MAQKKYKYLHDPIVLTGIIGLIIAACLLYWAQMKQVNSDNPRDSVGLIVKTSAPLKIKPAGALHWVIARVNQSLSSGDFIFTGDSQQTILSLKKKGKIILGPYSMIIINPDFIQVETGEIEFLATSSTVIKSFGGEIRISANSQTKIINTPSKQELLLSDVDKGQGLNIDIQNKLTIISDSLSKIDNVDADKPFDLVIEGINDVWDSSKESLLLTFSSVARFELVKLIIKNSASKEHEFKGARAIILENFPDGEYELTSYGYLNNQVVAQSPSKKLKVFSSKLESPKIEDTESEVEFFF